MTLPTSATRTTVDPDPNFRINPAESDDFRNPLWVVAIGTGCLLAAMAAVIALG